MNSRAAIIFSVVVASIVAGVSCYSPAQTAQPDGDRSVDERSYSVGYDLGVQTMERLAADGVMLDRTTVVRAFSDALAGRDPHLSEQRMLAVLANLDREVRGRQAADRMESDPVFRALAQENLRRGREYHESFAGEPGVETLPSGMLRRVIASGTGRPVRSDDTVIATFTGTLLDGYLFGEGREEEFVVSELIPGAQQMVLQMREGDHWLVALPAELAFGLGGRDPDIGPNESMLIDVQLVRVKEPSP